MDIFGIPFFDDDFYKMVIKLFINVIFLTGIIKFTYYKYSKNKESSNEVRRCAVLGSTETSHGADKK